MPSSPAYLLVLPLKELVLNPKVHIFINIPERCTFYCICTSYLYLSLQTPSSLTCWDKIPFDTIPPNFPDLYPAVALDNLSRYTHQQLVSFTNSSKKKISFQHSPISYRFWIQFVNMPQRFLAP